LIDAVPIDDLTVLKLGGSHALGPHLRQWLAYVGALQKPIVLVPGGGPFADVVRLGQTHMGFDDAVAHHLALIAMEQYGRALCGLAPRLSLARSLDEMRQARECGRVPVWAPVEMALAASDVPASWDLTSDSLAAWLTARAGAAHLVLVKHVQVAAHAVDVQHLVAHSIVDSLFPKFLAQSPAAAWLAGPTPEAPLTPIISDGDDSRSRQQPF
jgi:dihydroneopterin aldolase